MWLTMLIIILAMTWIEHAHASGFIKTFIEDMYTGTGLCGDVEQQSTSRASTTGHSISSDCGPETFPAEVEAHTQIDCPDDATYQSSFDHLNFNTIARDYFCSWMHSTPFNIPDEYRYSGNLKTDSMGACAVSDADTCLTGIKTARSRCAMPDEAGSVLIVPKPQVSSNFMLQGRTTDLQAPSFGNPKASYLKMDELFKFKSSESAFLLDSGGNLKSIDMSEYTATTPACESCQGGANCLVSHYAWFQPRGDTTKKESMYLVNGNKIQSAICEPQGIHGLNGWGSSQKTQCGSTSSSWYEVPSGITYKDLTGVPRLITQNPGQYLPGVTKGCAQNLNGVSGSVCDWVNAGCIVRRHKDTDPLKGSWYSEDRNIEYNDDGSLIQAVEFMRAVDDEFTILTSGSRFRVRFYRGTRCRYNPTYTIEFGDEEELKQKHAFRFTGSVNSLQFELVAEDGNTASCLGSGQTCESGYGVEVVDGHVTNTSVNWRSGIVQCHRCNEMEISSKVRHQSCDVYLSECVQCGKNKIPNPGKTACLPCDMNTPYRPVNETKCRECPRDMYWDYVYAKDCVKIPIMTILCDDAPIVVGGVQSNRGQLYVDPTKDMYRPNPSTNQVEIKDLIEGHYLEIRGDEHKLRRCTCGSFEYAYGCGGKFADTSSFDMYVIDDANPSSVQTLSTINAGLSGACDSINLNQYHLKREGECRRCQTCQNGYYNDGCGTDSGRGVCKACTSSCPNSNEYLSFEGDGCSDPQAVTDNVCKSCEEIKQVGGNLESKYYIVVGCGGSGVSSFRRWVMEGNVAKQDDTVSTSQGRDVLANEECLYGSSSTTACEIDGSKPVTSLYQEDHKYLSYCPRGWYIKEPTGTGWKTTWNRDVCYKCGATEQPNHKKASNYIPCDGASTIDTEIWIPACEVNFYDEKLGDGSFACRPCETCSSGFV